MNGELIQEHRSVNVSGAIGSFTAQVFGWMGLGLILTGLTSFFTIYFIDYSPAFANLIIGLLPFIFLAELILVIVLSAFWRRFNAFVSLALFFVYSMLNGLFLGILMFGYALESVVLAIGVTVVLFFGLATYGMVTKRDLTKIGNIAIFGLVGLVIATFVNIILSFINPTLSNGLYWITTYLGVGIFIILIAYDAQRLRKLAAQAEQSGEGMMKYSIQGALILYLDFINLFIRILAITGKKK